VGRKDGRPWGDLVAISGDFRWPPVGRFPWPPSLSGLRRPSRLTRQGLQSASDEQSGADRPSKSGFPGLGPAYYPFSAYLGCTPFRPFHALRGRSGSGSTAGDGTSRLAGLRERRSHAQPAGFVPFLRILGTFLPARLPLMTRFLPPLRLGTSVAWSPRPRAFFVLSFASLDAELR
jgi:hypothetical protein